ncbi:MAG TPA: AmpG family muropeptide MFS transporter [Longimicrobiales bacterium]|nr:AmpG family muropeptide MFS transporter [Longimicrobiales bacterium]
MFALIFLGISSGLPLELTGRALQAWMTVEKVDLATIGAISLVGTPYLFKWAWAPLLDRYIPPFLGRRRGWILIMQILLAAALAFMSTHDPQNALKIVAITAVVIAFLSATQDIAIDAYRTDVLEYKEMGAGAALFVMGYRIALIGVIGLAFILADRLSWPTVYLIMAGVMLVNMIVTWRAPEPVLQEAPPKTLASAVYLPFKDFFSRTGAGIGVLVLLFIVIYKVPEYMAQNMATPFLLKIGFSLTEIGAVQGVLGIIMTIVGTIVGGVAVSKIGINKSLWSFAILGAASNIMFFLLTLVGKNHAMLVAAVVIENFCLGLVNGVFLAFMMSMCNPQFSATQFALLSSLMATSRVWIVAPAGALVERVGWHNYFLIALAAVLPSLLLLPLVAPWRMEQPRFAAKHTGEVKNA